MKFDDHVISSREALSLEELPNHVVVVGGGYIGLELGITYRMLGSEVTIVEAMDSILPIFDKELRRPLELFVKKNKIKVHTGVFAKGSKPTKDGRTKLFYVDKNAKEGTKPDEIIADISELELGNKLYTAQLTAEEFSFLHPDNTVVCQVKTSRASIKNDDAEDENGEEATEEAAE